MANKYAALGIPLKSGATAIASVTSMSGPSLANDVKDVTTHDSPGGYEQVVATIKRTGEVSFGLIFDPADATHKYASGGLLYALTHKTKGTYSVTFPNTPATVWSFDAYVTGFETGEDFDGALTATVKLKITGQPTLA